MVCLNNENLDRNKMTDEYITYMAVSTSVINIYTAILLAFKSCERIRTSKDREYVRACVRACACACACVLYIYLCCQYELIFCHMLLLHIIVEK